ncbi:hypothetical protein [Egicoccus sp. AB-alg2]|uniref:hypothetical protein n=1 Tax=Egicoccus sp. AB-alg2 TaxID=3242693 RepID=UPI00359D4F94
MLVRLLATDDVRLVADPVETWWDVVGGALAGAVPLIVVAVLGLLVWRSFTRSRDYQRRVLDDPDGRRGRGPDPDGAA